MNPQLITLAGPTTLNLGELSDHEAALVFLHLLAKQYPGIRMRQLWGFEPLPPAVDMLSGKCKGLFGCIGSFVSDTASFVGRNVSDVVGLVGRTTGDAVRLASSEQVMQAASRGAAAYATGGASEAGAAILGGAGGSGGQGGGGFDILAWLGQVAKSFAGGQTPPTPNQSAGMASLGGFLPWILLGGAGIFLLARAGRK